MRAVAGLRASQVVHLAELRVAGALMLAAAAVRPLVPGQHGLGCPLRRLTGVPCPLCGMTTSVTHAVRLQLSEALAANPAGVVAVAAALVLLVVRRSDPLAVPVWAATAGLVLMWVFQLHRFRLV